LTERQPIILDRHQRLTGRHLVDLEFNAESMKIIVVICELAANIAGGHSVKEEVDEFNCV
jgi:hypothetical protein